MAPNHGRPGRGRTSRTAQPRRLCALTLCAGLLAAGLSGCDTDTPPDADAGVEYEPWGAVGGANDEGKGFISWEDGTATPPMLRGPQGGQHVWVSVQMRGMVQQKLRMTVEMVLDDTGKVVKPGAVPFMQTVPPLPDDPKTFQFSAITAFVRCPCQVANKSVTVKLTLDDLYGRSTTATAKIKPSWDGDCSLPPSASCKDQ